jgi:uncharacterized protein YPO0396
MSQIIEVNCTTNAKIIREATADELAQLTADKESADKEAAELAAKEAARQALLDKLGITADEAKLLLG